jgi:hypothetical protein
MFDRTFPPATLSYELDMSNPYSVALLDELCLFAAETPGSQWTDVYHCEARTSARGAATLGPRAKLTLRCVPAPANSNGSSSADSSWSGSAANIVIDAATGQVFVPPSSGTLGVTLRVTRYVAWSGELSVQPTERYEHGALIAHHRLKQCFSQRYHSTHL